MINDITMRIEQPLLPTGSIITSIDWELNTLQDFTGESLLTDGYGSPGDVYFKVVEYDFRYGNAIYGRIRLHITKADSTEITTDWSETIVLTEEGQEISQSISAFPVKINIQDFVPNDTSIDFINISTDEPIFFRGYATHTSTTYRFLTTSGVPIFERRNDRENKTSIKLDIKHILQYNIVCLEVVYNFDRAVFMPPSRQFLVLSTNDSPFSIDVSSIKEVGDTIIHIVDTEHSISSIIYHIKDPENSTELLSGNTVEKEFTVNSPYFPNYEEVILYIEIDTRFAGRLRKQFILPIDKS